jgi:hypothetical protein
MQDFEHGVADALLRVRVQLPSRCWVTLPSVKDGLNCRLSDGPTKLLLYVWYATPLLGRLEVRGKTADESARMSPADECRYAVSVIEVRMSEHYRRGRHAVSVEQVDRWNLLGAANPTTKRVDDNPFTGWYDQNQTLSESRSERDKMNQRGV